MTLPKFVKMPNLPFKLARRLGIEIKRDKRHGKVGGVCQGIADRFGFNVTLVRVITFVLCLGAININNAAFLTYLILWMILPPARPTCMNKNCDEGCPETPVNRWIQDEFKEQRKRLKTVTF